MTQQEMVLQIAKINVTQFPLEGNNSVVAGGAEAPCAHERLNDSGRKRERCQHWNS